jgi:hypothetical protein
LMEGLKTKRNRARKRGDALRPLFLSSNFLVHDLNSIFSFCHRLYW